MVDIILPLCLSRPSVYHHLSDKLKSWIFEIEQIEDKSKKLNLERKSHDIIGCPTLSLSSSSNHSNSSKSDNDSLSTNGLSSCSSNSKVYYDDNYDDPIIIDEVEREDSRTKNRSSKVYFDDNYEAPIIIIDEVEREDSPHTKNNMSTSSLSTTATMMKFSSTIDYDENQNSNTFAEIKKDLKFLK